MAGRKSAPSSFSHFRADRTPLSAQLFVKLDISVRIHMAGVYTHPHFPLRARLVVALSGALSSAFARGT